MYGIYNVIDYIDSPDIAEFNRKTIFTPTEQAILIGLSNTRTIEEKIGGLKYLADNYSEEDFTLDGIGCGILRDKTTIYFKNVVLDTIRIYEELLAARYNNSGVVYASCLFEKGFQKYSSLISFSFYTTYDNAYNHLKTHKKEYLDDEDLKDVETHGVIYRLELDLKSGVQDFDLYMFNETYHGKLISKIPVNKEDDYKLTYGDTSDMVVVLTVYDEDDGKWGFTDDTSILDMRFIDNC